MIWEITTLLLLAVYVYTILTTIIFLMMENRNPVKSIAWIFVLIFVPIFGFLFYILVGKRFRKRRIINKRSYRIREGNQIMEEEFPENEMNTFERGIAKLAYNNSGAVLCANNNVKIYTNATLLFDDIEKAILEAQKHINIEYYIFNSDKIGTRIMDALKKKAQEGVEIRMIVDDVGSIKLKKKDIKSLIAHGIQVMSFLEVRLPYINSRVNYRNHRKILVIDGEIGFTGGYNIADRYIYGLSWGPWRDTHIKVEGSVVSELQKSFFEDWYFVKQELVDDARFYPTPTAKGNSLMQIVISGPDLIWESIMQCYIKAFLEAQKRIYIETPYFLPPESVISALQIAALNNIDVRIILPYRSDAQLTLFSTYSYLDQMFKAGVKIYLYQEGFIHSKITIVDDTSFVGSSNMDFRSFNQNFELNAIIYDKEKTKEFTEIYFEDIKHSNELDFDTWKKRPLQQRLKESSARLFSPIL
ncbi:MAG: cardiolipin synthase [Paludibacteraceae bacterium]|nr:cardiolipin synthase [Paludibacteraceae bacterium]MBQ9100068.1 cardiolipin synthase [Paludibacteraceae bacterium]